jgi:isocitrate dehydrogenase
LRGDETIIRDTYKSYAHASPKPSAFQLTFMSTPIMSPSIVDKRPTYKIASIPADGIGPEVIEAGIEVLNKLAETLGTFKLEFKNFDWSSETYKKLGKYIPDGGLDELRNFDAILFGAVGAPGGYLVED